MIDTPKAIEGLYRFSVERSLQDSGRTILGEAYKRSVNDHRSVKGEIGERLAPNLLTLCGWENVERHPFNETKKEGISGNGPDNVMRDPEGNLSIVEAKYWNQVESAKMHASSEVARHFDTNPEYNGERIRCAYIAVMDWNMNDDPIQVFVKRVRPEETLND